MKLAEFDLLESKVAGLLRLHRDMVTDNRRLRTKIEEQSRELARLREEREHTQRAKQSILERIDKIVETL